jgi:hypothetical protein
MLLLYTLVDHDKRNFPNYKTRKKKVEKQINKQEKYNRTSKNYERIS